MRRFLTLSFISEIFVYSSTYRLNCFAFIMNLQDESAVPKTRFTFKINKFVKMEFSGCYTKTEKTKPTARSGHRSVADDNHIWLIGGFNNLEKREENESYPLFREVWEYNISTNQWKLQQEDKNMPNELASHSVACHENHMLVFGGTGVPFGINTSNQLSACHLKTGNWNVVESTGSQPDKIYGQAMVFIDSHLYIYGGTTGFVYNTQLHRFDANTCKWEKLTPNNNSDEIPPERYRHEIVHFNKHIFVLGGGTSSQVYPLDKVHVYSIEENIWQLVTTRKDKSTKGYPNSRRCHSCVQLDNKAYICGGYDGERILGDLWQFNIETLQWTKLANMPEPVYFHSAAITSEGCMMIFGGVSCVGTTTRTDSCYQIWLRIPLLQTMCWHTLLNSQPAILTKSPHELLLMGINPTFVNRLACADGA